MVNQGAETSWCLFPDEEALADAFGFCDVLAAREVLIDVFLRGPGPPISLFHSARSRSPISVSAISSRTNFRRFGRLIPNFSSIKNCLHLTTKSERTR